MLRFLIKSLPIIFLFLGGFLFFSLVAIASEINIENLNNLPISNDFLLEQGKFEIVASPGETIKKQISIVNRSGRRIKFRVVVEDIFSNKNSNSGLFFSTAEPTPYSLRPLIKLQEDSFYLDQGQRAIIPWEIKIPNNIQVGGLYGAITFVVPVSTILESRLSSLIFINIKDKFKPFGKLDYFTANKKIFINEPIGFKINVVNQSGVILSSQGKLKISGLLGGQSKEIILDQFYVMPESSRLQNYSLSDFSSGFYQAQLELENKNQGIIKAKTYFIVVTFKLIIFSAIIFFSLLLFIMFYNKKLKIKSNEKV